MLSQTFFNLSDTAKLEKNYKQFRLFTIIFLVISIPVDFLIAYLFSQRNRMVFWPIIIICAGLLLWFFYAAILKTLNSLKLDLSEQTKLVGQLQVISKTKKDKERLIGFDSSELKQISLGQGSYDKINIGDTLSVEVAKNSKHIFKLSRAGELIIGGD